jgi:inward rectifier potassium channel
MRKTLNTNPKTDSSDLGFGRVVSEESHLRLINKDGSFNVNRKGLNFFNSLSIYHSLLTIEWWKFIGLASLGYLLLNIIFAFIYLIFEPGALEGTDAATLSAKFLRAFFFSIQTSSTIGYGHVFPESTSANFIVALESFVGLLGFAIITGLLFARFSRPNAKILFSKNAVVAPYHDISAFEFRIANARKNQIIELQAQLTFSKMEKAGNHFIRKYHRLNLERDKVPFFPLTWTIVHPIDDHSPLKDITQNELIKSEAEFLILLTGTDDTFNQTVHSRFSYRADEIIFGAKFSNLFEYGKDGHHITVDVGRLSNFEKA